MSQTSSSARAEAVVWFRNDLRLNDHAPLCAAAASGRPVAACYVLDETAAARLGGASKWWLDGSLRALERQIARHGGSLCLRRGSAASELAALCTALGAREVHCTKSYEPDGRNAETLVAAALERRNVRLVLHAGDLLFDPEQLRNQAGQGFKVFTSFWNACQRAAVPTVPRSVPKELRFAAGPSCTIELDAWGLRPGEPDWAGGLRDTWQPGEEGARTKLSAFLAGPIGDYHEGRNRPDIAGSSRLSPHLHFGEASPRTVWHAASRKRSTGAAAFLRELGWREFARHLLWHWPTFAAESFRAEFRRFPWRADEAATEAWRRGLTGYPLVDAGMRELWSTGWMHNRVRMVAASFLVKHLLVPWQRGAEWFWDTLVDADLANNSVGWQWVAGSGADAAPYFRIFNPTLQGQKFDPEGEYVRRWVPELKALPTRFVHEPSTAPPEVLRRARVALGTSYPLPIVAHDEARARALAAWARVKEPTAS